MSRDDTLIFIDTCSLLDSCWNVSRCGTISNNAEKASRFWGYELPTLSQIGSIIVTKRNYDELIKLSKVHDNPSRPQLGLRCEIVLDRLSPLITEGIVSIVGDPNDPFADAILLSVALKFRTQRNLLFITQDRALATDLIAISDFQSVRPRKGYELKVRRIDPNGSIARWHLDKGRPKPRNTSSTREEAGQNNPLRSSSSDQTINSPKQEWWR